MSPIWGWDGEGLDRQASAALVPSGVTLLFQGDTTGFWGRVSIPGPPGGTSSKPTTGCLLPSPVGHGGLALPLNSAWLFLPLLSLLPESQCDQASCHYLPCVKMCYHPLSSFELKQDHLFSLFLTNINEEELEQSSSSTRASRMSGYNFLLHRFLLPSICLSSPPTFSTS